MGQGIILFLLCTLLFLLLFLFIVLIFYGELLRRSKDIVGGGLKIMLPIQYDEKLDKYDGKLDIFSNNISELKEALKDLIIHENKVKKVTGCASGSKSCCCRIMVLYIITR